MRKSFTWFLSLMVVLIAFAIPGYAQEAQETVELYAAEASDCYNESDDYTVKISVRDFIKLNKFELDLEYNDEIFVFEGASNVISSLSTTTVGAAGGVISLDWSGSATTIGDNLKTDILVLHFSVIGYPGNVANSYATDMEWVNTSFWYDIPEGQDPVNTDRSVNGSLAVNVSLTGIVTEMTSETCFGGEATVTVTAPEADLYLFNEDPDPANWEWTNSPSYLAGAGQTVTIRVKDVDGCMSLVKSVVIPETIEPVTFDVTTQNPNCFGAKGSVVINAIGGTAPYTYWIATLADGSNAVEKGNFQFSMEPGTYYVNVQDKNECADLPWVEIVIVDENEPIVITPTVTNVLCYDGNTGSIEVSVEGGASSVSIDNGISWKALVEDTYTFTGLTAGTYKVWAKNDAGCMVSISGVVVGQPAAPIAFDIKIDDTSCGGDNDGVITVMDVMGGTAPYEYSLDGETWVTDSIFTGLEPTYYSLWVRDANECTVAYDNPNGTENTIAVQSPDDIQYDVVITDPLCNNEAASVAIANVTGGTGSYIYSFDAGATWVDTMTIDNWVYPYVGATIWVANADSTCQVQQTIDSEDVDNPELLMVEVNDVFAPTCIDGTDGNIHLLITGGTTPYSYSINGSSWKISNDELTIIKASVGTHTILVKDANGCEWEEEILVPVEMDENVIWAESDDNIDCFGDKAGTISLYFNSWADGLEDDDAPVRGIQFYVQNEAGQISSFMPSNQGGTTTTFNAGTYIVWVVDQYTCESNLDTVVVTQNPELLITDVNANGASCFGTFEGTITVHATGGNVDGLLEYAIVNDEGSLGNIEEDRWLPFETYDPETTLSTVSFYVDGGTYWISVRDNDCDLVTYGPIEVDGYDELLVDETKITSTDPLCFEDENGTITVPMSAVKGGAGAYLFTLLKWSGNNNDGAKVKSAGIEVVEWVPVIGHIDQATGLFTGLPAGIYAVLVEDAEDCPSYTTEEPIILEDPELLEMSIDYLHMSCENANDGVITINVEGGTPGYKYAINNLNTWVAFAADANSKTYIATEPGTFTIWVKDANGCVTEGMDVTILEPTALSAEIDVNNATCNGVSNGEIFVDGIGGWEGQTEYWFKVNNGSWTSSSNFTGLPAGNHILYVMDGNEYSGNYQDLDCEYAVPFTVEQPTKITYNVVIEYVSCKDGSDGTLTVNVQSGGTPWYIVNNIDDEGYNIRITGSDVSTDWVRTGADNSHTFTGLAHSHYTVYIEDANGCELDPTIGDHIGSSTTVESWEVNEPDTYLTFEAQWIKDATCYNAEDGQFKVMADGGTAPYKYYAGLSIPPDGGGHILVPAPGENSDEWLENDTLSVGAGTWVVWVMDANGCIIGGETDNNNVPVNEWRVKVEQPDSIMWAFHTVGNPPVVHYVQPSCNGSWDGVIHLVNISGGSGVYNAHVWGISAAGEAVDSMYIDIEEDGVYMLGGVPASNEDGFYVTVLDDNGCTSAVDTIYVDQPDVLTVELQQSPDNYSCFGAVEGWIEATAEGGNGDYEYELWQDGEILTPYQDIASAFLVKVGFNYTVVVKDPMGCTDTASLWMPTPLEVGFSYEDLTCSGAENPTVTITATGTPGREFRVHYKQIEDQPANAPFITYNGWFTESITISDAFEYDNENYDDLHYAVYVEDENGCVSPTDTLTFDQVQTPLTVVVTDGEVTECTETYTIASIVGGVAPYVVMVDDNVVTEMTYTLTRGSHVVKVMDAHMCSMEEMVEVVGMYVTRDTTINTYIGEETAFVDVEAGIDTMLAVGMYELVYSVGCERTLNVTVVEVPRAYTIAEVQGAGDVTPMDSMIVQITGTVTAVVDGEGFFVQDAVAAWSGIWVAYVTTDGIEVGDGVVVVGEAGEVADVTTIMATEVSDAEGTPAITPIEVTPTEAEAEMYESVLVHVPGARATTVDAGSGEWTIYYETTDNLIVNDWLYLAAPVADNFYNVTGIVNGRLDVFKLEPRMASDVTSVATGVNPNPANAFKVYPNPFSDRIMIDNNDKLTRVVVSNIAGQKVIDIQYPNREIRTANLVSGIYVISLYTENGIVKTDRMIKR